MNNFFKRSMENALQAKNSPAHNFKKGDQVIIRGEDYCGKQAEVVSFETNELGAPLIIVSVDTNPEACFYAHELEHFDPFKNDSVHGLNANK